MSSRTSRAVATVALVGGALSLVHVLRVSPDPLWAGMHLHAALACALFPAAIAGALAASNTGISRVLAAVGAVVAGLGWILNLLPSSLTYEGTMGLMKLVGPERMDGMFDLAAIMVGLGLALALGGSAIPDQPVVKRVGAGIGAALALLGPILLVSADPVPFDPAAGPPDPNLAVLLIPAGLAIFGVTGLIAGSASETLPADPEAWLTAAGGARTFGVALALFMIAGMLLGRLAGVDDRKVQEFAGLLGQVATVALLAVAAWGLRGMCKAPDAGSRSLAGVGLAGALAASIGAGIVVLLVAAAFARVIEAPPEAIVGERSPMGAAAWFIALVGLCIASIRIGIVHRWAGLVTLASVTLVFFTIGSFAQAIPPQALEHMLGGANEAAPFIGPVLALPGLVLGLVLTSKVGNALTEAYRSVPQQPTAPMAPPYAAGYPAGR